MNKITPLLIGAMLFALLLRYAEYDAGRTPIPEGGDPPHHNIRAPYPMQAKVMP